jgi:nucleotide-binding universal stress UspA family protein
MQAEDFLSRWFRGDPSFCPIIHTNSYHRDGLPEGRQKINSSGTTHRKPEPKREVYMFEKILVAINFSDRTQKILECIGRIPGVKEVMLFHIFDATRETQHGWIHGQAIENAKILMDEMNQFLTSQGYLVTSTMGVLKGGEVYEEILRSAENQGVSLIVTGARERGHISDILLKSISQNILRHAKTSVLVYPDTMTEELSTPGCGRPCPELFSSVLIPTDFSPSSRNVVLWATGIRELGEVTLLNVVDRGETEHEIKALEDEAQKNLDDFARDLIAAENRVKTQIRVGNPAEMILSAAESDNASVILMSPHGSGGFMELYIGSTTFEVVKRTPRPVLVVRTGTSG